MTLNVNILISGEDVKSVNILAFILKQEGYDVDCTVDPNLDEMPSESSLPDLMIFDEEDITPRLLNRIATIREITSIALLLICSDCTEDQIISAYEAGIDAYLVRPFTYRMLCVHVATQLRRARVMPAALIPNLQTSTLSLDPERHVVTLTTTGTSRQLTNLEFRLLYCLVANRGHVLSTETIIEKVWGYTGEGDRTLLKGLVSRLRGKVEPSPRDPTLITTIPGIGYIFNAD